MTTTTNRNNFAALFSPFNLTYDRVDGSGKEYLCVSRDSTEIFYLTESDQSVARITRGLKGDVYRSIPGSDKVAQGNAIRRILRGLWNDANGDYSWTSTRPAFPLIWTDCNQSAVSSTAMDRLNIPITQLQTVTIQPVGDELVDILYRVDFRSDYGDTGPGVDTALVLAFDKNDPPILCVLGTAAGKDVGFGLFTSRLAILKVTKGLRPDPEPTARVERSGGGFEFL